MERKKLFGGKVIEIRAGVSTEPGFAHEYPAINGSPDKSSPIGVGTWYGKSIQQMTDDEYAAFCRDLGHLEQHRRDRDRFQVRQSGKNM